MSRMDQLTRSVRKHETALRALLETIENRRKLLQEMQEEYTELLWQKAALLHEIYNVNGELGELSECPNDEAGQFLNYNEVGEEALLHK